MGGLNQTSRLNRLRIKEAFARILRIGKDELGLTEWTLTNYSSVIRQLTEFTKEKTYIDEITTDELREFLKRWENAASKRQMMARLKTIFNVLEANEMIEKNPMKPIRTKKGLITKRIIADDEWLTFDEANKLEMACGNIEERATIKFGLKTGVRRESLVKNQRKTTQIDLEQKKARVFEKREKERYVYFNGEIKEAFQQLFDHGKTFPCFTADELYARLAQITRKAGITKKVTPITLRHTFACHSRLKGIKLEDLRDLMGHENIQTTLIYANVGATEQQKAYERVWGQ